MNSDIGYSGQYLDNKQFRIKVRTGADIANATGDAICGEMLLVTGDNPAFYIAGATSTNSTQEVYHVTDLTEKVEFSSSTPSITPSITAGLGSSVDLEMLWVEPGTFMMGSPTTESGRSTTETQHQVTLTQGFHLGKYEVTIAQYEAVMTGNTDGLSATPSNWASNPNWPVSQVSWDNIQVFLRRLNEQQSANIPVGWAYALPTDAEWEYACRAGTTTTYSWGDTITASDALHWEDNQAASKPIWPNDVGSYAANPWGFLDMHGNVQEWVADKYVAHSNLAVTDPMGPKYGSHRVIRGGNIQDQGQNLRSAFRGAGTPSNTSIDFVGFRVALKQQYPYQSFKWNTTSLDTFTHYGNASNTALEDTYVYTEEAGVPAYTRQSAGNSYGSILLDPATNKWGYYNMYSNGLSGSPDILITDSNDITNLTIDRSSNLGDTISDIVMKTN